MRMYAASFWTRCPRAKIEKITAPSRATPRSEGARIFTKISKITWTTRLVAIERYSWA